LLPEAIARGEARVSRRDQAANQSGLHRYLREPTKFEFVINLKSAKAPSGVTFAFRVALRLFSSGIAFLAAAAVFVLTVQVQAQQTQSPPVGRVIVIGEGSVSVTPDYA
jgi:hypothetical protein